jgi:predicted nucleic acid-binding protein
LKFDRLAFDSNAAIDLLRQDRRSPPPFAEASALVMPLFVLAELRLGFSRANLTELLAELVTVSIVIAPDAGTVDHYVATRNVMLRARTVPARREAQEGLNHDIWIAALCLQHDLPLLTNDRDFDQVGGLRVIRW